jgi:hypothetical protein
MKSNSSAIILSEGYTATTDYYLVPYLENLGYCFSLLDYRLNPPEIAYFADCQLIIISRYISYQWLVLLKKLHQSNIKIIYFMDDDLFDLQALVGLPWGYRWRIFTKALRYRSQLLQLCNEFWVSTPYLAAKYSSFAPALLSPISSTKTLQQKPAILVCYHGTASHNREIDWLLPIIEQVQSQADNIQFELFGDRVLSKRVNRIPRVYVLHPMSWPNYLSFTQSQKRTIALAPLLDNHFNAARGATKFYDYARMEAVGIYSNVSPYLGFIRDQVDGLLLNNEPDLWVEKILQLTNDFSLRKTLLANIKQRT